MLAVRSERDGATRSQSPSERPRNASAPAAALVANAVDDHV